MNIIQEIKDEIRAVQRVPSSRDLTILAALFLVLPGVIGSFLLLWKGSGTGWVWIVAGAALAACRLIPPLFQAIYNLWIGLSIVLGYFVSRILLTVIFFLVITPTGLIMRVLGKDPMERSLDPGATTYWRRKEQEADTSIERYEKQF
ncbi:MAG: hypothetical protein HY912_13025 [Desulfomonile tiedjei]|uniref:SxtJ n=1 Tax=Desulfomonile tiedjei TaxID=2358 RepID=A0A9D6Z3Z0_9BACT|nr:hypothetical protein [Desulfomonile tiedjei]